jgi:trk system potassium uptake protein TrkH
VIDLRPILFIVGILLTTLAVAMVLPAIVDAAVGHPDWRVFLASAGLTMFVGVTLILTNRTGDMSLNIRQAFMVTTASWTAVAVFGALPFAFAGLGLNFTDAFFESMSGITTTGATVIVGLDYAPPGILIWRALLQWLGGVGFIVTAVGVLPMLRIGGMQIFRMDFAEGVEKTLPRTAQIAIGISTVYLILTALCTAFYWGAGMSGFDAIAHSFTTIATGGYSTHDASIAYFDSHLVEWIATIFMILSSLPFLLYLQLGYGNWGALFRDRQVRAFLAITAVAVLFVAVTVSATLDRDAWDSLRTSSFNVVSILTGTGFATEAYDNWGPFALTVFFVLMFIGGCAGSTTCGIKVFRFQVLYAIAGAQMKRLLRPHGVYISFYNKRPITEDVALSVLSFFFIFVLCFVLLTVGLGMLGLDFITAVSSAATAIANVGPGLGPTVGPAGNFSTLPDAAKWLLSIGMLLGRLELFTVLVLFTPAFWRN